jgi:hypothetical protein
MDEVEMLIEAFAEGDILTKLQNFKDKKDKEELESTPGCLRHEGD